MSEADDHEALVQKIADMMGASVGFSAVPRDVLEQRLRTLPPAYLRQQFDAATAFADQMLREGKHIVYDPVDLERTRELQRKLK